MQWEWRYEEGFDEDKRLSDEWMEDVLCQHSVQCHGIRDQSEPHPEA